MDSLSEKQREIVSATLLVISNYGIQSLTIKRLSTELGVSEGALYKHFKSKNEIIMLLLRLFQQTFLDIYDLTTSVSETSIEKLENIFREKFRRVACCPELVVVMDAMDLFKGNPGFTNKFMKLLDTYKTNLLRVIVEGQATKEIKPDIEAEHIYLMIIGSIHFLMKKWARMNNDFDIEKEGEKLWVSVKECITG